MPQMMAEQVTLKEQRHPSMFLSEDSWTEILFPDQAASLILYSGHFHDLSILNQKEKKKVL